MSIALNGDGIISGVSSITVGAGASVFSPAANTLALGTNGSERVRVDASGNVGVGSDIPGAKLDIQGGEFYYHSGTSNNLGIKLTYSNGNSTGIIDTYGNHALEIRTNNTERLRVLAAGGLTFNGDTAAANALDDYEEGTFTPVLSDASSAGNTTTGGTVYGYYLKVGKWVTCTIGGYSFSTSGMTAGNTFYVQGLPFQCQATGPVVRHVGAVTAERCNGSTNSMTFQVVENQVYGLFVQNGETGASARTVIVSDFSTGNSYFRTTIAYSTV